MNILFGPPGDSTRTPWFTSLPDHPETASETLWITPTQRRREWVRDRCRDHRRCFPPRIHTFDELVQLLYERLGGGAVILAADAVRTVLLAVIRQAMSEPLLNHGLTGTPGPGFIDETARQIDELQRHGMSPETLDAIPSTEDGYGGIFLALFHRYRAYLDRFGKIDAGGMQVWVADRLRLPESRPAVRLPWTRCVFDGFLELTPLQLDIMKELDALMDTTLVWPGNPAPRAMFHWMSAGIHVAFPDAVWTPLTRAPSMDRIDPADTTGFADIGEPAGGGVETADKTDAPDTIAAADRTDDVDAPDAPDLASSAAAAVPELARAAFQLAGSAPDCLPDDVAPRKTTGVLRLIERDTRLDEVTAIARDIRIRMQAGGAQWRDFGVTFPDLQACASTVRRIFARYAIPVNISQSLPLTGSPVFTSITRLLRLTAGWQRTDVLAVLGDSGLTGFDPETTRTVVRTMAKWSSEYHIVYGRDRWIGMLETIIGAAAPDSVRASVASAALSVVRRLAAVLDTRDGGVDVTDGDAQPAAMAPALWLAWLRKALGKLEINRHIERLQRTAPASAGQETPFFEYTRRAYNRLLEFLDAVEPFLSDMPETAGSDMTLAEFRDTLPRMLAGVDYQLTTQTGDRVQVLGLLGIRALTFRHVYFGGLTEAAFPRRNPVSPFWSPETGDTLLDKPANASRISAFADLVRVMYAPLETLTLSRPMREADEDLLPSPLLEYLFALYPDVHRIADSGEPLCLRDRLLAEAQRDEPAMNDAGARVLIARAIAAERLGKTGRWSSDLTAGSDTARTIILKRHDENTRFSASALETWIACPRRFFFERVLRLAEPDEPTEEISAMDRGNLAHAVLKRFYRERLDRPTPRIHPDEVAVCAERIREIAEEEFAALRYGGEAAKRQLRDITGCAETRDEGLAVRFARLEAEGAPELQPFRVEWSFGRSDTTEPFILNDCDGRKIRLDGTIDRIDVCEDDTVIWDYKTGRIPGRADIAEFQSIQIGLYMLAAAHILKRPVRAGGYYQIPPRLHPAVKTAIRCDGSPIATCLPAAGRANTVDRNWPEAEFRTYMEELPVLIGRIVSAIRHGCFPAADTDKACQYCSFVALCRRMKENHDVAV